MTRRGFTLIEMLMASVIGIGIILALSQVDVTRVRIGQKAQGVAQIQLDPGLAVTHLARSLVKADRVNLISASNVQIRIPPVTGTGLDDPANYTWVQYKLVGTAPNTTVKYWGNGASCGSVTTTFNDIASMTVQYKDEAGAPPGGTDPLGGPDNNVLEIIITSTQDPQSGQQVTFRGEATLRSGAYTDLMSGLLPSGVGEPPTACP